MSRAVSDYCFVLLIDRLLLVEVADGYAVASVNEFGEIRVEKGVEERDLWEVCFFVSEDGKRQNGRNLIGIFAEDKIRVLIIAKKDDNILVALLALDVVTNSDRIDLCSLDCLELS